MATATYEKTSVCLGLRQRVTLSSDRETELSCAQSLVQCSSYLRDDKSRCRLGAVGIAIGRSDHLVFGLHTRNFFSVPLCRSHPIDFSRLLSQIVVVLVITALLVVAFKKSNQDTTKFCDPPAGPGAVACLSRAHSPRESGIREKTA